MLKQKVKGYLFGRAAKNAWKRYSESFNRHGLKRYLIYERSGYPLDVPVDVDEELLVQAMRQFATHCHSEFLYDYTRKCYVEPWHGYVITDKFFLIEKSFSYYLMKEFDQASTTMLWNIWKNSIGRNGGIKRVETVVSLRNISEGNYWHFYDDILSKLLIIDRLNLGKDVPLLVGPNLWNTRYFQSAIQRGTLKNRNWMLHTDVIQADRLVFCGKMSLQRENLEFALEALDFQPKSAIDSAKRIFLNRGKLRGRYLANLQQVIPLLTDFGFQVVDTDGLELQEQMELFSQARYVIGVHGAGLLNLIFRRNRELNLLELFPPDFLHPHYVWLCHAFGYSYDALIGTKGEDSQSFVVDLNKLRKKVTKMLHPTS